MKYEKNLDEIDRLAEQERRIHEGIKTDLTLTMVAYYRNLGRPLTVEEVREMDLKRYAIK